MYIFEAYIAYFNNLINIFNYLKFHIYYILMIFQVLLYIYIYIIIYSFKIHLYIFTDVIKI